MSVGLAFSGGGVPAAIGAACAWNAIADLYPSIGRPADSINLTVSTVSGGSIGYGLWVNAHRRMRFPTYRRNLTLDELDGRRDVRGYLDDTTQRMLHGILNDRDGRRCDSDARISVGEFAAELRRLPLAGLLSGGKGSHWWTRFVEGVFEIVCVGDVSGGKIPWISSFALLDEARNARRSPDRGALRTTFGSESLHHIHTNMTNGNIYIVEGGRERACPSRHDPRRSPSSAVKTLSYGSAFWAAPLLAARSIPRALLGGLLLREDRSSFCLPEPRSDEPGPVVLDGGVIDTTGVVGLLRRRTDRIVAFYNNNVPLSRIASPIAYLFGVRAATDSMNGLLGPSSMRVFPPELYKDVIANLTDPRIALARLRGVPVLENRRLGVEPYALESLVIFSNSRNDGFVLEDGRIRSRLSPEWPDGYALAPPLLDSNVLCAFNDWKVRSHREVLDTFLNDL